MAGNPHFFSPYDQPMWESVSDGTMKLQSCADCGQFRYPPGACCPNCLSTRAIWTMISGRGKILSWATFHRQYLPAYPAPTTCIAVQLEEGPIIISKIADDEPRTLTLDARVELVYGQHPDGYALPQFRLVTGDANE